MSYFKNIEELANNVYPAVIQITIQKSHTPYEIPKVEEIQNIRKRPSNESSLFDFILDRFNM